MKMNLPLTVISLAAVVVLGGATVSTYIIS